MENSSVAVPRIGMSCMVRNRLAVIHDVRIFFGGKQQQYLVKVSYKDCCFPASEDLLWDIEPSAKLLEPATLPVASTNFMPLKEFDAMIQACRWSAGLPFIDVASTESSIRQSLSSPFYGAVEPDDYQLVPLLKALRMPRVNLMIADDVGLGKTIEAGLIINELLIRRRINRILILCPAALRVQWKDEMQSKFSLPFEIIDQLSTVRLKKEVGLDANPWRYYNRAIASYHYLKQALILEQFRNAIELKEDSPRLPWDMLIVDEAHNLMPSPFGKDSDLCKMLRQIVPLFEHKIFLTATPHNGNTLSFSGLLEMLDPARFRRTDVLTPSEKERVQQVVIRRLKREINTRTNPPKFCTRMEPEALSLDDDFLASAVELQLIFAVEDFKHAVHTAIASASKTKQLAGCFAIEVLGKRLLSCPMTFIESWKRCKASLDSAETVDDAEINQLKRSLDEEITDDKEAQQWNNAAASKVGAWLRTFTESLSNEIREIDKSIQKLGIDISKDLVEQKPKSDARFAQLVRLIEEKLKNDKEWKSDERLVIFTEYKTTQDYLLRRLTEHFNDKEHSRILILYGGMDDVEREVVKSRFNDEGDPVRILLATDAASEGLNLQETARYLLHFDCPWNPSRLEQRNGRLDRHGQARDVYIFHFTSTTASDLQFLSTMIKKVNTIREDLGTTGELFDLAVQSRLIHGKDEKSVLAAMDETIDKISNLFPGDVDASIRDIDADMAEKQLAAFAAELDLDNDSRHNVLATAMSQHVEPIGEDGCFRILKPDLSGWKETIDESVRVPQKGSRIGGMPKLTFSIDPFLVDKGGRKVFRNLPGVLMLHLGHPLMRKACSVLTRRRYPGRSAVSRLTASYGSIPDECDAFVWIHFEEMAVNKLRETFHYWVRSICFPVKNGKLADALPHIPAIKVRHKTESIKQEDWDTAEEIYSDIVPDLRAFLLAYQKKFQKSVLVQLALDQQVALKDENTRFQSREAELSSLIREKTIASKRKELENLERRLQELPSLLFQEYAKQEETEINRRKAALEQELKNDQGHYEELRLQLQRERQRITKYLLPNRYTLDGDVQIYPLAVEIVLPRKGVEK